MRCETAIEKQLHRNYVTNHVVHYIMDFYFYMTQSCVNENFTAPQVVVLQNGNVLTWARRYVQICKTSGEALHKHEHQTNDAQTMSVVERKDGKILVLWSQSPYFAGFTLLDEQLQVLRVLDSINTCYDATSLRHFLEPYGKGALLALNCHTFQYVSRDTLECKTIITFPNTSAIVDWMSHKHTLYVFTATHLYVFYKFQLCHSVEFKVQWFLYWFHRGILYRYKPVWIHAVYDVEQYKLGEGFQTIFKMNADETQYEILIFGPKRIGFCHKKSIYLWNPETKRFRTLIRCATKSKFQLDPRGSVFACRDLCWW